MAQSSFSKGYASGYQDAMAEIHAKWEQEGPRGAWDYIEANLHHREGDT
jgi:hypothetical protein